MKFADDMLNLYRLYFDKDDQLSIFVHSVLEQYDYEALMSILQECSKEDLEEILAHQLIGAIQEKLKDQQPHPILNEAILWKKIH